MPSVPQSVGRHGPRLGEYCFVYIVSKRNFGYYEDDDGHPTDEHSCVYIDSPLQPGGVCYSFKRSDLRKPPFVGEDGGFTPW